MNFLKKFFSLAKPKATEQTRQAATVTMPVSKKASSGNGNEARIEKDVRRQAATVTKPVSSSGYGDVKNKTTSPLNAADTGIVTLTAKRYRHLLQFLIFLFPLFFLPLLANQIDLAKQLLLIALLVVFVAAKIFEFIKQRSLTFVRTALDLPLVLLALIYIVSIILSVNRYEAFLGGLPILLLIVLYFVITQMSARFLTTDERQIPGRAPDWLSTPLLYSASVIAIFAVIQNLVSLLVQRSGISLQPVIAPYFSPLFSPTGSLYSQGLFLAAILFYKIYNSYKSYKNYSYNGYKNYKSYFLTAVILTGLLLTLFQLYLNRPILMPILTGWRVAANTLGVDLQHALFGVGPNHYLSAFTRFKDIAFNNTPFWHLRFSSASNFYFQLLTEVGIAGLFAYLFLIYRYLMSARLKTRLAPDALILGAMFLTQLFLPSPFIFLFLIFVLLASKAHADDTPMTPIKLASWPALTYLGCLLLATASIAYLPARYALADFYFRKSLQAIVDNRGGAAYEIQKQTIRFFPQKVDYRLAYAQTNFALANSLAARENITDNDRQTIVQLVSQAVREAKIAVSMAPGNIVALENMAQMYRGLINFAQNADVWALASYNSAIQIDPSNPRLRLDRGGLLFQAGNFEEARNSMQIAANLKPDYTNAYYNLAKTFEQIALLAVQNKEENKAGQNYQLAIEAMNITQNLVCKPPANQPGAAIIQQDCDKATSELAALQQAATAPTPSPTASPTPPGAAGTALPTPTGPFTPKLEEAGQTDTNLPQAEITPPPVIEEKTGELEPSL